MGGGHETEKGYVLGAPVVPSGGHTVKNKDWKGEGKGKPGFSFLKWMLDLGWPMGKKAGKDTWDRKLNQIWGERTGKNHAPSHCRRKGKWLHVPQTKGIWTPMYLWNRKGGGGVKKQPANVLHEKHSSKATACGR